MLRSMNAVIWIWSALSLLDACDSSSLSRETEENAVLDAIFNDKRTATELAMGSSATPIRVLVLRGSEPPRSYVNRSLPYFASPSQQGDVRVIRVHSFRVDDHHATVALGLGSRGVEVELKKGTSEWEVIKLAGVYY